MQKQMSAEKMTEIMCLAAYWVMKTEWGGRIYLVLI